MEAKVKELAKDILKYHNKNKKRLRIVDIINILENYFIVIDIDSLKTIEIEELKKRIDNCISIPCSQAIEININEINSEIGECAVCLISRIIKKYKIVEKEE